MKIDCPHCGVHGSVDDELAGKKLKCPKCTRVFLVPEELLPEAALAAAVSREVAPVEEPETPAADTLVEEARREAEERAAVDEVSADDAEVGEETEDVAVSEDEESSIDESEASADDDDREIEDESADEGELKNCSVCGLAFAESFLVEIDSKLYCSLCEPESEEESLETAEEDAAEMPSAELEDLEDDTPEIDEIPADTDDSDEQVELVACDKCGESLNPDLLEEVGSKRFCALCISEDDEEADDGVSGLSDINDSDAGLAEAAATAVAATAVMSGKDEEEADTEETEFDENGQPVKPCSECGEKFHPDFLQNIGGKLFCGVCQPEAVEVVDGDDGESVERETDEILPGADFSVGDVLKEAWQKTKGAKGAVWGGMIVMYLLLFGLTFGAVMALSGGTISTDPAAMFGAGSAVGLNVGVQVVSSLLSMVFTAGIMLIGVRRAQNQRVSWKMVFAGLPKVFSIAIAMILQFILVGIGFVLLVLPGIYLTVGYALTLPLILEKGYGPWQALEASRKAIHKKWWTVFGVYLLMMLIYAVSMIPAGIGLIWTIPMFFVALGVLYRYLFVSSDEEEDAAGDEMEEREE